MAVCRRSHGRWWEGDIIEELARQSSITPPTRPPDLDDYNSFMDTTPAKKQRPLQPSPTASQLQNGRINPEREREINALVDHALTWSNFEPTPLLGAIRPTNKPPPDKTYRSHLQKALRMSPSGFRLPKPAANASREQLICKFQPRTKHEMRVIARTTLETLFGTMTPKSTTTQDLISILAHISLSTKPPLTEAEMLAALEIAVCIHDLGVNHFVPPHLADSCHEEPPAHIHHTQRDATPTSDTVTSG